MRLSRACSSHARQPAGVKQLTDERGDRQGEPPLMITRSAGRSFGFNHCVPVPEQSRLPYVRTLFFREAPVEPPGVSFVRWAKRDALPLAVAQLELKPHVVFARTFTHVAAAFLPLHYGPVCGGCEPL